MSTSIRLESRISALTVVVLLGLAQICVAQVGKPRTRLKTERRSRTTPRTITTVTFVLLTNANGLGLRARQWSSEFERLNISLRIRRGTPADKIDTRERSTGRFRQVTVTGQLDRRGKLEFKDRSFARSEVRKLEEWIRELKAYGAKGAPTGKPLWGLSKARFGTVYSGLAKIVQTDVSGKSLKTAVLLMKGPAAYPVRFSTEAEKWLQRRFSRPPKVRHKVRGLSYGTALAIVLHDRGLGFRPLRTPRDTVELVVDPISQAPDVWPIGWEPNKLRSKIAPKLYKMVPVELKDVYLTDVLNAVTLKTGVPILLDHAGIAARGIPIDKLKVSYARRKASWSVLVRGVTVPQKLTRKFRVDERGNPFIWIQPLVPTRRAP